MTKKLIALLMALSMVFALTACGGSEGGTADEGAESAYSEDVQDEGGEAESAVETEETAGEETGEASTQAQAEGVLTAEQEEQKEQLKQLFTMAAQGRGTDGFDYYLAYNDDVSKACLLKADHDNQQCVDVTGDVTEDEEGWLTVTDSKYGYSFSFALQDQSETGVTMLTTNDVEVEMEFVDVDRALTNILGFEATYTIIDPSAE